MPCCDVELACCRLCKKPLASNLAECIHCGVCKPIENDKCCWWQRTLFVLLIVGTILATLRYEMGPRVEPDCAFEDIGRIDGC